MEANPQTRMGAISTIPFISSFVASTDSQQVEIEPIEKTSINTPTNVIFQHENAKNSSPARSMQGPSVKPSFSDLIKQAPRKKSTESYKVKEVNF